MHGPMKHLPRFIFAAALLFAASPPLCVWANSAPPEESAGPKITLVPLNPLMVPVLKGNRVLKYIVVNMDLEPAPETDAGAVTHDLPRAHDALLREAYLFARENDGAGDVDLEALRARLLPVIKSALGDKTIKGLYFTGASTLKV